MYKQTRSDSSDIDSLVDNARALMAVTTDVAGDKVVEARKCLATALGSSGKVLGRVKDKTIEAAQASGRAVRENTYRAVAIALGISALVGYLTGRRCSRNNG